MTDKAIDCPCQEFIHPADVNNQSGLKHVQYRSGDFDSFRRALLLPLPDEQALRPWRPTKQDDLVLQILEWWAYIADVLTLYTERSLNENLLATAEQDHSVRKIVQLLGYRHRPGIAGSAKLGFLLGNAKKVKLPEGFAVDSKPAPGQKVQTFETGQAIVLSPPSVVNAEPPSKLAGPEGQIYLVGEDESFQPGEMIILEPMPDQAGSRILLTIEKIETVKDSAGKPYTALYVSSSAALPEADAKQYRILRSQRSVGLWKYSVTSASLVIGGLVLEGLDRGSNPDDPIIMWAPADSALSQTLLTIKSMTEEIWYADGDGPEAPSDPDTGIAIPVTCIGYDEDELDDADDWETASSNVRVLIAWRPGGKLRNAPVSHYKGEPMKLRARGDGRFKAGHNQTVLIEDADGKGVLAKVSVSQDSPADLEILSFATQPPSLKTPLRVIRNLAEVTRGKSVKREVLGSGDSTRAGQEFVLKKSPLTYLPAGDSYKSTLAVYVNGVLWQEAQSFYQRFAKEQIYVTYEDDEQKTHVVFGDGINGSRLPTGRANVVADYRYGSGAEAPEAGSLTVIANPVPGVRAVRQPVDAGGGSDPELSSNIRRYAPRSVLTFGRAISADDYEAIAAQAPGVQRAQAVYGWNAAEQRSAVTLYVGDTDQAVQSARDALQVSADPNRPVSIIKATAVEAIMLAYVRVTPDCIPEDVALEVRQALANPDTGLLGLNQVQVGQSFFFSEIAEACLSVNGVQSVAWAVMLFGRPDPLTGLFYGWPPRVNAAVGEFFRLPLARVFVGTKVVGSV